MASFTSLHHDAAAPVKTEMFNGKTRSEAHAQNGLLSNKYNHILYA